MLAAIVGLIGAAILFSSHISVRVGKSPRVSLAPIFVATLLLCLVFSTIYFSRAEAIERLFAKPDSSIDRVDFWASSLNLFVKYFPFGFGPGSFVPAFQSEEPIALLNQSYLNRLHNDWLETGLTFGVPGILLMLSGLVYYARRSFLLWFRMDGRRSNVVIGRMASIIFAILGIASMSDYPMRTPAMMGFAVLVLLWFAKARREPKFSANDPGKSDLDSHIINLSS